MALDLSAAQGKAVRLDCIVRSSFPDEPEGYGGSNEDNCYVFITNFQSRLLSQYLEIIAAADIPLESVAIAEVGESYSDDDDEPCVRRHSDLHGLFVTSRRLYAEHLRDPLTAIYDKMYAWLDNLPKPIVRPAQTEVPVLSSPVHPRNWKKLWHGHPRKAPLFYR